MKILKNVSVPTGNILVLKGEKGNLECLSIGDYGKQANIKADFLGIHDEINGVKATEIMPLSEKWVVTISTQYGCSMNCKFCDVPNVGKGRNATLMDLHGQVWEALKLHPEVNHTKRLNIHYARMGEPTFNKDVLVHATQVKGAVTEFIGNSLVHPVVSTMLPRKNKNLIQFLQDWCIIKNGLYGGNAGLQFSINSTDDKQREFLFSGNSLPFTDIAKIGSILPMPVGRKYALNFALSNDSIIDVDYLSMYFGPSKFMIKITPIHETITSAENKITTSGGYESYYPYKETEEAFKKAGFDVLVFIPSKDEEESRITCGNAILYENKI